MKSYITLNRHILLGVQSPKEGLSNIKIDLGG